MNTVAAGANHTLAITPYGTVIAVGLNTSGQLGINSITNQSVPVEIPSLYGVIAVAAGELHSLALTSDGKVWSWGNNNNGQLGIGKTSAQQARSTVPVQVIGISERVISLSTQGQHSLALTEPGKIYAWGNNQYGQIGNNTSGAAVTSPVDITAWTGTGVTQIAAGANHNLAVKAGTVLAWGYNYYGQLGNNGSANLLIPTAIASLSGISKVTAGGNHSLALTSSKTVYAWGYNAYYQLGDGTVTTRRTPQLLSGLSNVVDIAAGARHSAALTGIIYSWGSGLQGQLGTGATATVTTPAMLYTEFGAVALAAGWYSTLYATADGSIRISGDNAYGQVGDTTTTDRTSFVSGISPARVATAIYSSALAVKPNGTLWGWGSGMTASPALILGGTTKLSSVKEVAVSDSCVALKQDKTLWSWSPGGFPAKVSGISDVVTVSRGQGFTIALKSDGTVWTWGSTAYGQLGRATNITPAATPGQVTGLTNVVAVAAGDFFCAVLKQDGTVWGWGRNDGQLGPKVYSSYSSPVQCAGQSQITAISAGRLHLLSLKSDGTVWGSGANGSGIYGVYAPPGISGDSPVQISGLSNVAAIAAGYEQNYAVKADGSAWSWGLNFEGGLGDGTTTHHALPTRMRILSRVARITGGAHCGTAVDQNGCVWAWGRNSAGQIGDGTTVDKLVPVPVITGTDSDNDTLPDLWELHYFGNLSHGNTDDDADSLLNRDEFLQGTDPTKADTDGDGITDWNEINASTQTNPLTNDSDNDGILDTDDPFATTPATGAPPQITILTPQNGSTVDALTVPVTAQITADRALAEVRINSLVTTSTTNQYSQTFTFPEGQQTVPVYVRTVEGRVAQISVTFTVPAAAPPQITILTPQANANVTSLPVTVTAQVTANRPLDEVRINSVLVSSTTNQFSRALTLSNGPQTVTVSARSTSGQPAVAQVAFTVDASAPGLTIVSPADDQTFTAENVQVKALAESSTATVTINGKATTRDGFYYYAWVHLNSGENTITATLTDESSRQSTDSVEVNFTPPDGYSSSADDDGDGAANGVDLFPNDPNANADNDNDGVADGADPNPNNPGVQSSIIITSPQNGAVIQAK